MNEQAVTAEQPATAAPDEFVKVCLSNRTPVNIREAHWPVLTDVTVPIFAVLEEETETSLLDLVKKQIRLDCSREDGYDPNFLTTQSALHIVARQHCDGRTLLYGESHRVWTQFRAFVQREQSVPIGGELLLPESMALQIDVGRVVKRLVAVCGGRVSAYDCVIGACVSAIAGRTPTDGRSCFESLDGGQVWIAKSEWEEVVVGKEEVTITYDSPSDDFSDPSHYEGSTSVIAEKQLAVYRSASDTRHLVLGQYQHTKGGSYELYDMLVPQYAALVPSIQDVPQAILEIGMRMTLTTNVVQTCINGLPAEDLV